MKQPRKLFFDKNSQVPNSPLPVLLYRSVFAPSVNGKAERFRKAFRENGWVGLWTDTIYDYTHFHSNAHEVLGIAEGKVTVRLGGDDGRLFRLRAGDMVVLPAGVGHRRVGGDEGLKVIGAYPVSTAVCALRAKPYDRGQAHFDMKREGRVVPKVELPERDPVFGEDGALVRVWGRGESGALGARRLAGLRPAGPIANRSAGFQPAPHSTGTVNMHD